MILVLLIMTPDRREPLLEQLEACGANVLPVSGRQETRRVLRGSAHIDVVVTDEALVGDWNWRHVMEEVDRSGVEAPVIVCSRLADAEFRGAYDVLVQPYERGEVQRILDGAAAECERRWQALAS
jgi:DNA-binding NtrC family response regulator